MLIAKCNQSPLQTNSTPIHKQNDKGKARNEDRAMNEVLSFLSNVQYLLPPAYLSSLVMTCASEYNTTMTTTMMTMIVSVIMMMTKTTTMSMNLCSAVLSLRLPTIAYFRRREIEKEVPDAISR